MKDKSAAPASAESITRFGVSVQNVSSALPASAGERRRVVRYACSAAAEVTDEKTRMKIDARITDLGLGGCYVDTLNILPAGSAVRVHIKQADHSFEAPATVIFSFNGMGMGLAFTNLALEQQAILHAWIDELSCGSAPSWEAASAGPAPLPEKERQVLNQLITLLVRKRYLSTEEAGVLLEDLYR